ncbi:plasmid pRiA4b ORF-3 family protein [Peptococcaceae bacterium 1198_IL3148]
MDELVVIAIRKTFQEECIREEVIERYIYNAKEITYTKTKNRTSVARMNKVCDIINYYDDLIDNKSINQSAISREISRNLVGDGKNKYIKPNEELYKDLETYFGGQIFSTKAVVVKAMLDLEKHRVWRRLVVPVNLVFNRLHKVLQAAFGWKSYHLHEFYIYSNERQVKGLSINHSGYHKEGYKPIVNLVCDEAAFGYDNDVPMQLETGIKLSEYIPAKIKYNYDFGDNWQHYIEVEIVIDDYDKNYAVCLEGEGNTPPEDVGGEHGYQEFLKIIANKEHPEHEHMINWAKGQGYKEFDIETVNRKLRQLCGT